MRQRRLVFLSGRLPVRPVKGRVIKIKCKCGFLLFEYYKDKKGRLQKCYLERIRVDNVGVSGLSNNKEPICPKCSKKLGRITQIHGIPALKINHGTIEKIRT